MIAAVITFYLFIDKKTVEVNIIPETNIPENTAGEPYLDKAIPGSATVEALPNSAEVPPSPLPAGPPAPNTSYNLTPNAYPVISPTSP